MWPSFLNLGLGFWMAAASLPLVIHLLSQRRYRTRDWAAMRFLNEALKKSTRRLHLEQLLLLAIRTLIIMLVVMAMMQPYFDTGLGSFVSDERTHKVIVLDGSFSMGYAPNGQSLFKQAQQMAADIVRQSRKGDGFTVVLMSNPPREIIRTPAFETQDVLQEIDAIELPHAGADVPDTLNRIEKILQRAAREVPQLRRQEVYFISDLQRASWRQMVIPEATLAAFRARSKSAAIVVLDVGQPTTENIAVTQLQTKQPFATLGEQVTIDAQVQLFGRQARNSQRVELLVDGQSVAEQAIDLTPGSEKAVVFSHAFRTPGAHALEVRTSGDALEIDNHRWQTLKVREAINVLLVNGKPTADTAADGARYLKIALSPNRATGQTVIRPEVLPETALVELPKLNHFDCIFLCNVKLLTEAEATRLDAYLKNGGGLVIFLGDQVVPESYNRWLGGGDPRGNHLLPAHIGELKQAPADRPFKLDPLRYAHPILSVFRGNDLANLADFPVRTYFKLKLPEKGTGKVVMAVGPGDPFLVEQPYGRGQVVLCASSADAVWTGWPILPTFLPFVQETLRFALLRPGDDRNVLVGQPLTGALPTAAAEIPAEVELPNGKRDEVRLTTHDETSEFAFPQTTLSGPYRFVFGPPVSQTELFAVNVNPQESDLAKLDRTELETEIWPGVELLYQTTLEDAAEAAVRPLSRRGEWHGPLLYAALALILLETLLAWKFAHHAV